MTGRDDRPLVAFCMEWVPSYRQAFYERLRPILDDMGIDMLVIHGAPPTSRRARNDSVEPPWATFVGNREATIAGVELTWQPVWKLARRAELVIMQQEAALLLNYLALAHRRFGGPLVALWGHGENSNPASTNNAAEALKKRVTPLADWFFAYTERSGTIVEGLGVPAHHITVVNNSRTSDALTSDVSKADHELVKLLGTVEERSEHIGWMVSALDTWKRLPFLVDALDATRARVPDFEFFVLGQGDDDHVIFDAAESRPWLHALGSRFADDKAAVGAVASVTIQPGLIGLHVVDAFAFGTPMITTEHEFHSHEFDYLEDDENAVVLPKTTTADEFGAAVAAVFEDPDRLERLRDGCTTGAERYTIDAMVERFAKGIESALTLRKKA